MKKNAWVIDYVRSNYEMESDREMAVKCSVNYVTVFNIRKKHNLHRSEEFNHSRRVLSGIKGGSQTQKTDRSGENNSNWKSGISKNNNHYYQIQKNRFPEKIYARRQAINARKRGDLIKKPCEICGEIKSFAHHEDYTKPLEVVWLCRKHHDLLHKDLLNEQASFLIAEHHADLSATIIEVKTIFH